MKKLIYLSIILFLNQHIKAQWIAIPDLYLKSEYVGMNFEQIISNKNLMYALIDGNVYLSYNNGESWMYASSKESLYANCIAGSETLLYVGTNYHGIHVSNNYGTTYLSLNQKLPENCSARDIIACDSIIAAAIYYENPFYTNNVFISKDYGENWSTSDELKDKYVECLVFEGDKLYAGTHYGVYLSTDYGKNWSSIGLDDKSIYSLAVKGDTIYAGESNSSGNLFLSTDNGDNWKPLIGNGLNTTWYFSIVIQNDYVFVSSGWDGVFRSNNNGDSWTTITNGINAPRVNVLVWHNNKLFAGCSEGVAITENYGNLWNHDINTYNLQVNDIGVSGNNIIATTNQGINITPNKDIDWDRKYISMNIIETLDSLVYYGSDNGYYYSLQRGENPNWYDVRGLPDQPKITDFIVKDSLVFASLYGHGVYYSEDYGVNWRKQSENLINNNIIGLALIDSVLFAATDSSGIFISNDLGLNWNSESIGLEGKNLTCLAQYKNTLYVGTNDQGLFIYSYKNQEWQQTLLELQNSKINSIYTYGNNVFLGVEGKGLFMSSNNGKDWHIYNEGLFDLNVNSIAEDDTNLYIGTDAGAIWKKTLAEFPISLSIKNVKVNKNIICPGESIQLEAQAIGGQPPYIYKWSNDSIGRVIKVTPFITTKYTVTVTDANSDTSIYDITAWVKHKPEKPTVSFDADTLISSYTYTNHWMFEGEFINNWGKDKLTPIQEGIYTVMAYSNGCFSDTSDTFYYSFTDFTNLKYANDIKVFPNPANEFVIINLKNTDLSSFEIEIYSLDGILIKKLSPHGNELITINIEFLNNGIYCIAIRNRENSRRIIKYLVKQ